jgi:hypothetical protein
LVRAPVKGLRLLAHKAGYLKSLVDRGGALPFNDRIENTCVATSRPRPVDRTTHITRVIATLKEPGTDGARRCREGAVDAAIARAVEQLERGELSLEAIEIQLLDAVLCAVGPEVDRIIEPDVAPWRERMRDPELTQMITRARAQAARELLRLPVLRWTEDDRLPLDASGPAAVNE